MHNFFLKKLKKIYTEGTKVHIHENVHIHERNKVVIILIMFQYWYITTFYLSLSPLTLCKGTF